MDMSTAIAPKSDQMNADDLIGGPRTLTITRVDPGSAEQPVNVHFAEFPRPWRPSKGMARALVSGWGMESDAYIGHRVTLFRNPKVTFGKDAVGGIQISHMSHLPDNKPLSFPLTESRTKRSLYTIQPLPDSAPSSPAVDEETVRALADLRAEWKTADPDRKTAIEAEVARLGGAS